MKASHIWQAYWLILVFITMWITSNDEYLRAIPFALVQLAAAILFIGSKITEAIEDKK